MKHAEGVRLLPTRGGVITIRFGVDVQDVSTSGAKYTHCVRYGTRGGATIGRSCGHKHKSRKAAGKCSRSMSRGYTHGHTNQIVRIEDFVEVSATTTTTCETLPHCGEMLRAGRGNE